MKQNMHSALNQDTDLTTLAELAEIALEQGLNEISIKLSEQGLLKIIPFHAERVRFYCILMRAHHALENDTDVKRFFKYSIEALETHLGPSPHPLHIIVYKIMINLLVSQGKMEDAKWLYKSSIMCSMKILGQNHVQTAHVYMDTGQFYLKWHKRNEALSQFENAY